MFYHKNIFFHSQTLSLYYSLKRVKNKIKMLTLCNSNYQAKHATAMNAVILNGAYALNFRDTDKPLVKS